MFLDLLTDRDAGDTQLVAQLSQIPDVHLAPYAVMLLDIERIASKGCGVVGRRHRISTPRKLYLVGRTWAGTRLRARGQERDG